MTVFTWTKVEDSGIEIAEIVRITDNCRNCLLVQKQLGARISLGFDAGTGGRATSELRKGSGRYL